MLIITRNPGESVYIGKDIYITVISIHHGVVKFGIKAPKNIEIYREEIAPKDWTDEK